MARLYGRRWTKARNQHLEQNPYCVYCEQEGRAMMPGNIVDHIKPHRGDPELFWEPSNWQTLCKRHHDAAKQSQEKGGQYRGCNADGVPLDTDHHWNK